MNKKFIALAIAAAAVSTGATAAEIAKNDTSSLEMGGRVEARLAIQDGQAQDQSRVRLNFLGKTDIADGLYGLGFYEGEFKANNEEGNGTSIKGANEDSIEHRYMFAGIGGAFGEVTMGTVKGSLAAVTDFTDIQAYHGAEAAKKLGAADRPDRAIAYSGEFSGLEIRANYMFAQADVDTDGSLKSEENSGYAASAIYNIGETGARVTAAYAKEDQGANDDQTQYMLGASYAFGDFYVAGLYNKDETKVDSKTTKDLTGYELAAAYTLGQAKFTTTYNRADDDKQSGDSKKAVDAVAVDATYFFNANFRTYASYKFNLLDEKNVAKKFQAENQAVLGLRYDF